MHETKMERIGSDVYKQSNVRWVITHVMDPISISLPAYKVS